MYQYLSNMNKTRRRWEILLLSNVALFAKALDTPGLTSVSPHQFNVIKCTSVIVCYHQHQAKYCMCCSFFSFFSFLKGLSNCL